MNKRVFLPFCAVLFALLFAFTSISVLAAENDFSGRYSINIQLKQFGSDEVSMGSASIVSPAVLVINGDEAHIEISLQPMMYLGREGYLAYIKKVTGIIEANKYGYPSKIETEDATVLEEYTDVYDVFNSPGSIYLDSNAAGKWYPKTVSISVDVNKDGGTLTGESEILVQIYVPVMESIMKGSGTKFARLMLDYSSLEKTGEVETTEPGEKPTEEESTVSDEEATVPSETETAADPAAESQETALDRYNLTDGEYVVNGNMVKADRETLSMSDNAISHKILLNVRDGRYYLTMRFSGISVGDKFGYLGNLRYYLTGYTTDSYGNPRGDTAPVTVKSYLSGEDGEKIADSYGTDYPCEVEFEMIPEALDDSYVPLQVFVPLMESISGGAGTQTVFLSLNWETLEKATSDNILEDTGYSAEQAAAVPKGLANKALTAETGSALKSGGAVKTGEQNSWAAVLLFSAVMVFTVILLYRKRE